jgi:hypothetical protein
MSSFEGRATQIIGDMVQIADDISGHSVFLPLRAIVGGLQLRLRDRVLIEGPEAERRGRRLTRELPAPSPV